MDLGIDITTSFFLDYLPRSPHPLLLPGGERGKVRGDIRI